MKRILFFLLFSFVYSVAGYSCLNEYRVSKYGDEFEDGSFYGNMIYYRSFDTLLSRLIVEKYERSHEDYTFEDLSDVAIHMSHLGRYEDALNLTLEVYKTHSNEYGVVANLGTFYELNGQIDSAYFYIKKSIEINEDAHNGSEWVHLKILEAKKAMIKDDSWILNNNVIQSGMNTLASRDLGFDEEEIAQTANDIVWQMKERVPFTPNKDLLVANIFRELGQICEVHLSIHDAIITYQIAVEFDPEDQLKTVALYNELEPIYKSNPETKINPFGYYFPEKTEFVTWPRSHYSEFDSILKPNGVPDVIEASTKETEEESDSWLIIVVLCCIIPVFVVVFTAAKRRKNKN